MNWESPAFLFVGDIDVVVGVGLYIVNVCVFDIPPPGVGLKTEMYALEVAAVKSLANIVAVSWVEFTNVVALFEPLNLTVEPETKFVPLTVRANWESPSVLDIGEISVVVGTGLLIVTTGEDAIFTSVPESEPRD
ncbi:MAG: hypothetical protein PHN74_02755 [Candidatus Pacebacteria bacterium]|nr:hypothetical protein [Candidatus Paceibacterota bacterium]